MDNLPVTGLPAPEFVLPDLNGKRRGLKDELGKIVVINFWSAECPHAERTDRELVESLNSWGQRVSLLPIASNANEPQDLLDRVAAERGLPVVLLDSDQQVADLYGAVTTPHIFVIDPAGILRYQGAFDDVTFRQRQPTRHYLKDAVTAIMDGKAPIPAETASYGCTVVRYMP